MGVDLYSRSLISHVNGLKPHLQACSAFYEFFYLS